LTPFTINSDYIRFQTSTPRKKIERENSLGDDVEELTLSDDDVEELLGTAVTCAKSVNPFEVQYDEKILAASVSAAATCEELQTVGRQAAMDCSPPDTKLSGVHQHFEVEQPLEPRKFSQAWAQLSWSL